MADVFDRIFGQPAVREFLRSTIASHRVSHGYLFSGPAGSNKTQAAFSLASALLCPEGGCGVCEVCERVNRRSHPDVHFISPEGASGYLIEQIRDLISDVSLAPIQGKRKIYILDRIDLLGTSAANAFLKVLEEPPANVVFILLGRTRESVLPTIVSRCLCVPFRSIPPKEAAAILAQRTGASPELAAIAIESCGGSITRAAEFLKSNERLGFRNAILEGCGRMGLMDLMDSLELARSWVVLADGPLDAVRLSQKQDLEDKKEWFDSRTLKLMEKQQKRELSTKAAESMNQLLAIVGSFFRDVLAVNAHAPELVINYDVKEKINEVATSTNQASVIEALDAVERARQALGRNVSPEVCLDALIFEIGEALNGTHSPR